MDETAPMVDLVTAAREWVAGSRRIVVLTGAGISTDSGIPDFRGPNGVWTRNPEAEKQATLQHYLGDPDVRRRSWQSRVSSTNFRAEPNDGHRALVELERQGRLAAIITQNVDGLHQKAGSSPDRVIEVHGSMHWTRCWSCQDRRPMTEAIERVGAGEDDPPCLVCGGILKSDTISFGQALVPEVIDRAMDESEMADLFLAVGSTLSVYPAAGTLPRAKANGAHVVIVNGQPTEMDLFADELIMGEISEVLPALVR
jgi:NAD-dependent deacetylase